MGIHLSFLGAARNVTGSRYLVETDRARLLVDCGLHQERSFRSRDWEPFPVEPSSIDAVILTHAHLDHCGYLPRLLRGGFRGKIFGTPASCEIARIVLLDSAHIQEEDARYKKKRHKREGRKSPYGYEPLYDQEDAEKAIGLFEPVPYHQPTEVHPGFRVCWQDAGHILGSSSVQLRVEDGKKSKSLFFSGDLGRDGTPILQDPEPPPETDVLIVESTYGDRVHGPEADVPGILERVVLETLEGGGNLLIPAFSIGRTQEVLYHFNALLEAERIPPLKVFLDSPMAIQVTEVFRHHGQLFDQEMLGYLRRHESPFDFFGLHMSRTVKQSKAINHVRGTAVIMAGSGMCTGGRIKHHLVHNIQRPECTILFVGYQARGTLGRLILEGKEEVRILGRRHRVRAQVRKIAGLSAHADADELDAWLSNLERPPERVFVTHGEEEAALAFGERLGRKPGWRVTVPRYRDRIRIG